MTRDRYSQIVLGTRTFQTIIDGSDKHDWSLLDPAEQPAFDAAWNEMRGRLGYAPVVGQRGEMDGRAA